MKQFYEIKAPEIFKEIGIGETMSSKPAYLKGRTIKLMLKEVMPSSGKNYFDIHLKVSGIEGDSLSTILIGHECSKEFLTSVVRRGRSKISSINDVTTKDGKRVRVKSFAITIKRAYSKVKSEIRKKIKSVVEEESKKSSYNEFMVGIFENKIQEKISKEIRKIYPIRVFEIYRTELLK